MKTHPKIVIFGLPFSPNVGDGVIADCISFEVLRIFPNAKIVTIDLSGRTGVGETRGNRDLAIKVLQALPKPLSRTIVSFVLGQKLRRIRHDWDGQLADADAVLIGGGQLFSDVDLNFPIKVASAAKVAENNGCPTAVIGAGVADNWSTKGRQLFLELAKTDFRAAGLRDTSSLSVWDKQIANSGLCHARLCRDPGLLAIDCYGFDIGPDVLLLREDAPIGVGVSDAEEIALHADHQAVGEDQLLTKYCDIILEFARKNEKIQIFSNGATRDHAFAEVVFRNDRLTSLRKDGTLSLCAAPTTGQELASQIAQCKAILAYRLHACIVAWSLRIPFVGIRWDKKLDSFASSVNLSTNIVDIQDADTKIADRVQSAIDIGQDPAQYERIRNEVREQISGIISDLGLNA